MMLAFCDYHEQVMAQYFGALRGAKRSKVHEMCYDCKETTAWSVGSLSTLSSRKCYVFCISQQFRLQRRSVKSAELEQHMS